VSVLVKVISISDEVYEELSRMKNGLSFTELFKKLISECENKGDGKSIIEFLKTHEPISEDSAKSIMDAVAKGKKSATQRKFDL
jgi:predicted CopG family antitoxin